MQWLQRDISNCIIIVFLLAGIPSFPIWIKLLRSHSPSRVSQPQRLKNGTEIAKLVYKSSSKLLPSYFYYTPSPGPPSRA